MRTAGRPEQPDYAGLVALLPYLRHLVDSSGMVVLEPDEAERIRSLGFQAQAGLWRTPTVPAALVAGNPLLEALGDDTDAFWRPRQSIPEPGCQAAGIVERPTEQVGQVANAGVQSRPPEVSLQEASETDCTAILGSVERAGGTIGRRKLQKKLWRIKAEPFNRAIHSLVERDLIRIEGKMLVAPHADGIQPPGFPVFHDATQPTEAVPPVESALSLSGAADRVSAFRGSAHTQHREEGD